MKLHNPNNSVVRLSRGVNITINPGETIDVDLATRQRIAPFISFFRLQLLVEDKDTAAGTNTPVLESKTAEIARDGAISQVVMDPKDLEKRKKAKRKDVSDSHAAIPRDEEKVEIPLDGDRVAVQGDVHLDDEPTAEEMEDLLFTKEVGEALADAPKVHEPEDLDARAEHFQQRSGDAEVPATEAEETILPDDIDTSQWGDGEDEDYLRMVRDFGSELGTGEDEDDSQSIGGLVSEPEPEERVEPFRPPEAEDPKPKMVQTEQEKWDDIVKDELNAPLLPDDDLTAFAEVWDISGQLNKPEPDPSEVPEACPYTQLQLMGMVKAKLWELAQEIGVDGSGTKRDLVARIISYYEDR